MGEGCDGGEGCKVDLPDVDGDGGRVAGGEGGEDFCLGGVAFVKVTAGDNEVRGVEAEAIVMLMSQSIKIAGGRSMAYRCLQASFPNPLFAPVITMVLPEKSASGTGTVVSTCPATMDATSLNDGIFAAVCGW